MKYTDYDKAELHCHLNGSIPINTILKVIDNKCGFKEHDYIIDKPVKTYRNILIHGKLHVYYPIIRIYLWLY